MTNETTGHQFDEIIERLKSIKELSTHGKESGTYDKTPSPIPLIDPTANVLALVTAETKRQDDMRAAESRRLDDLREKTDKCAHEIEAVRAQGQRELASAESKRIDAITLAESRRLDALLAAATNNVALASEKAGAQAATLAAAVASSAEALRNQVASTSASTATLITQVRESLEKRLQIVEQNQFAAGGASVQRNEGQQRSQWSIGIMVSIGFGLISSLTAMILLIMRILGK